MVLLGPQSVVRTVPEVVRGLGLGDAPVATITAGWEERERDDADLHLDLGGRTRNLGLFPRAEDVFKRDKELRAAMYKRYDRMNRQALLYRAQLAPIMATLRQIEERMAAGEAQLAPERDLSIRLLRELDEHRLRQVDELDAEVFVHLRPTERHEVARHREEVRQILDGVAAVLIAGGHVGILLNRLRLFGVVDLLRNLPIVAWAAGAMVLTERIVLFHDHPPEGNGDPEVHVRGLGLARGAVVLPNAARRLDLDDRSRVGAFAARFAETPCLTLDPGARLAGDAAHVVGEWTEAAGVRRLTEEGVHPWKAS
jgi:hypothetical protein